MDHGEGNRVRPVVEFGVEDVFVVDDYGEREQDPDSYVGVGEEDFLEDSIGESSLAHRRWGVG